MRGLWEMWRAPASRFARAFGRSLFYCTLGAAGLAFLFFLPPFAGAFIGYCFDSERLALFLMWFGYFLEIVLAGALLQYGDFD